MLEDEFTKELRVNKPNLLLSYIDNCRTIYSIVLNKMEIEILIIKTRRFGSTRALMQLMNKLWQMNLKI